MFKNLNQFKKSVKIGMSYEIVENAYKPESNGKIRVIEVIQSNGLCASGIWLMYQKAKYMRFNIDNTIDFLIDENNIDSWMLESQKSQNKDYWLKIKLMQ